MNDSLSMDDVALFRLDPKTAHVAIVNKQCDLLDRKHAVKAQLRSASFEIRDYLLSELAIIRAELQKLTYARGRLVYIHGQRKAA